ncbi:hypothetical protein [Streptomyces sp. H39-S7]|uniref:hypothetical protein n=1 Tax=Streptomyces sp. H39-S7 TaxID=3004357 RepID=UPI0022AFE14D|nr:hypothetical protein [Streptomyces sp. H39-S7]MCZ4125052.1 hypothetical protein [Streptomyces sp. H39-S7]
MIFCDLDRIVRKPRDLEDLIGIVEYVHRPVIGATGGRMNLINDNDRHMARMMCVMALKSSEDTARRVARLHLASGGRRGYGDRQVLGPLCSWPRRAVRGANLGGGSAGR